MSVWGCLWFGVVSIVCVCVVHARLCCCWVPTSTLHACMRCVHTQSEISTQSYVPDMVFGIETLGRAYSSHRHYICIYIYATRIQPSVCLNVACYYRINSCAYRATRNTTQIWLVCPLQLAPIGGVPNVRTCVGLCVGPQGATRSSVL